MTEAPYLSEYQAGYVHRPVGVIEALASMNKRTFDSGATRDTDNGKLDFAGFLSPEVLWAFAEYMHRHRIQSDGTVRASDNWKKGIPKDAYLQSLLRHVMDLWLLHNGRTVTRPESGETPSLGDTLAGIFFNVQGYWHEDLRNGATGNAEPSA